MARDCPFLKWDNNIGIMGGLCCIAMQERVETGSALYNSYCHNYESGFSRCPHFKAEPEKNNCYLTSACVDAIGLADDCIELMTLRRFRDNWLVNQPGGREQIEEYYRIAPVIVDAIYNVANCDKVLRDLYNEMIVPCVIEIEAGRLNSARKLYEDWTLRLKKKWIGGEE